VWIPLIRLGQFLGLVALGGVTSLSAPHSVVAQRSTVPRSGAVGYDVGAQSCSTALPTGGSFGVVGVTAGRPFHPSSCLVSEYAWAKKRTYRPQYYVNLANPGRRSVHWGVGGPRTCHRKVKNDAGCAYNYGIQAAAAAASYVRGVGGDPHGRWWLDVEVDNTWGTGRAGIAANIADIRGARHYLRHHLHAAVGVYTETSWWTQITRGAHMVHVPVWGGGANSKRHARQNCRSHSITGGRALLAQWIAGTTDHDLAC
jgi:hypothetical protein